VAHALQGVGGHQPVHLLLGEGPHAAWGLGIGNDEASASPSLYDLELGAQLHSSSLKHLSWLEPLFFIRVDRPKPEEDHQGLGLQRGPPSRALEAQGLANAAGRR